ncbi:MAG: hypothetical protein M1158_03385 [Candidatus Marsarchaeota archaeon]|nr:hypothetical protein [Candidatus Marsarchaeota archaeon]
MINSIELKDWKTHRHSVMEFQKGVNVLVGLMGAGKSSVMDAISFALFGTFPALEHKRVKIADIPTSRPSMADGAEVRLTFDLGSDIYTVTRSVQRGKSSIAKLEKNGRYLQTQPERVTEEIESALKINYDTFSRAVYAEQNRLDYFLELDKKSRKREIDEMLGLDHFAAVEDNATSLINSIKSLVKEDEQVLAQMSLAELKGKAEALDKDLAKAKGEEEKLKNEIAALSVKFSETKERLEKLKRLNARRVELGRSMEGLKGKADTLKASIAEIDAKKLDEEQLRKECKAADEQDKRLEREVEEAKGKEQAALKALTAAETAARQEEKRQHEKEALLKEVHGKDMKELSGLLEAEKSELQRLIEESASAGSRRKELAEWIKELSKHLSKCPVCERELDDGLRAKLLADKKGLEKSLGDEMAEKSKVAEQKRKLVAELERQTAALQLALGRLKDYEGAEKALEEHTAVAKREKEKLDSASAELKARSEESNKAKNTIRELTSKEEELVRRRGFAEELSRAEAELGRQAAELAEIKADDKQLEAAQSAFTEQSASLSAAREKLESERRYMESVESQLKERRKELDNAGALERRIARSRERVTNLNKFKEAIISTEGALRARLVSSINELMLDLWPRLYPYGDYSAVALKAYDDDYALETNVGANGSGAWVPVNSVASGGERSVACLALRIAMAMVIVPNLRWLILDEPTHNIDSAGISKLIDVFGSTLPGIVEQIFIITHDDSLKQIGGARVFSLDRDKSANGPTVIE